MVLMGALALNGAMASNILVMDFDCTLSQEHLFKTTHDHASFGSWKSKCNNAGFAGMTPDEKLASEDFGKWIMGGDARIAMLAENFDAIHAKGGRVEICTWSEITRVQAVLGNVGLLDKIDRIHGKTADARGVNVWSKGDAGDGRSERITKKQDWMKHLVSNGHHVIFVDDTSDNYKGLEHAGGVQCFNNVEAHLAKDGAGLTSHMMQSIMTMFDDDVDDVPPPVPPRRGGGVGAAAASVSEPRVAAAIRPAIHNGVSCNDISKEVSGSVSTAMASLKADPGAFGSARQYVVYSKRKKMFYIIYKTKDGDWGNQEIKDETARYGGSVSTAQRTHMNNGHGTYNNAILVKSARSNGAPFCFYSPKDPAFRFRASKKSAVLSPASL